jgi:hypothetical protein
MISDEYQMKAAALMQDAAERMERAAASIDESARRIAHLLEDGYGGNGLRLIELLEKQKTEKL